MMSRDDCEDIDAALAEAFSTPEAVDLADPKKRRARERRMRLSPDDGRRKRSTGRTKQFNCKMTPELHRQIVQTSRLLGKSITVMCEDAFVAYLEKMVARRG